jgi:MoaA/NifB/PqqE/SkfB family radical SAM enzyme
MKGRDSQIAKFLDILDDEQKTLLLDHLNRRLQRRSPNTISIVFDLTRWCNLQCKGCGVDAQLYSKGMKIDPGDLDSSTVNILSILRAFALEVREHPKHNLVVHFGGGEPFLRPDLPQILEEAAQLFGPRAISLDTNGCAATIDEVVGIMPFIGNLGISLDGFESYHNWWRRTSQFSAFQRVINLVKGILAVPQMVLKTEITTVPTRKNIDQIPTLT